MSKQTDEKQKEKNITDKRFIGMKELHQNLKDIADAAQAGKSFTVMRHNQPVFDIAPSQPTTQNTFGADDAHTVDDLLEACSFASEEGDLSKRVDEIVYDL